MMNVKISVLLFLVCSVSVVNGKSMLEKVIKDYEERYGLVFDVANILSDHQQRYDQRKKAASADLAANILQMGIEIAAQSINENDKFQINSPLSIANILFELALGARHQTLTELLQVFGFDMDPEIQQNPWKIHEKAGSLLQNLATISSRSRNIRRRNTNSRQLQDSELVTLASGIFIQNGITLRPNYRSTVERMYKAEVVNLDFHQNSLQAREYINKWVERKTHGKIQQMISEEIPNDRKMIIVSALYFRAVWENPFIKGATLKRNFYPEGIHGKPISVSMMTVAGIFPYYESKDYGCRIVGLPYKGDNTAMYVVVPNDSSRRKLVDFQVKLSAEAVEDLISHMEMRSLLVSLPKMHLKNSIRMNQPLSSMGVRSLFDSRRCDLSLMIANDNAGEEKDSIDRRRTLQVNVYQRSSALHYEVNRKRRKAHFRRAQLVENASMQKSKESRTEDMFVEDIMHMVDLDVNENGTEGAAVTASIISRSDYDEDFLVNQPFLLLIRHSTTKLPLFYGAVFDPRS